MHLLVIDPGYAHQNSHHHEVNGELARYLGPRGWTIHIAASARIDSVTQQRRENDNVKISPHFETSCYRDNIDALDPETHNQLSACFSDELVAIMRNLPNDATILLHTGFSPHFKGLADALARSGKRVNWTVIVLGMFSPYGEGDSGQTPSIEPLRYRHALTSLEHLSRARGFHFCFAVPCRLYQRLYAPLCHGHAPPIHPAVNYRPYKPVTQETKR